MQNPKHPYILNLCFGGTIYCVIGKQNQLRGIHLNTHVENTAVIENINAEQDHHKLHVKRRNSLDTVPFNLEKIRIAVTKAFKADLGLDPEADCAIPDRMADSADLIAQHVSNALSERFGGQQNPINIESIQDQVEIALTVLPPPVARKYIIFREERAHARQEIENLECVTVTLANGKTVGYDKKNLMQRIKEAVLKKMLHHNPFMMRSLKGFMI